MAIYKVQGPNGEIIEIEGPDGADPNLVIQQAQTLYKPKPVSQQQQPVTTSGGAAVGVFRPQGRRPESQNDREASKEMPLQTARGVVTGTLGAPADILNLPGQLYGAATQQPAPYRIPYGSEDFNQMLPGQSDTPQSKLARFGGEVLAPVPTVKGIQQIPGAAKATYQAGKNVAGTVGDVARYGYDLTKDVASVAASPIKSTKTAVEAFGRGYSNPANVGGEGSALMPIRESYYPHEQVDEFLKGQRTPLQMNEVPTSTITQSSLPNRFANNMAPVNEAGQALVAPKGKGIEGYFENLGSTYKQNPYLAALDVASSLGGMLATGLPTPITALSKSVPALAARQLQKATQFEPNFSAEAVKLAQAKSVLQPGNQPLALPAPTAPVSPTRTMYVNPEGQATTNVQGTQVNYTPGSRVRPNFATIRNQNQTAAQQSQQLAAQKLQELQKPQKPVITPEQQQKGNDILAQIRARNNRQPPEGGTPVVNTPQPKPTPTGGGSLFDPNTLPSKNWNASEGYELQQALKKLQDNPPQATKTTAKQSNLTDWGKKTTDDKEMARGLLKNWFEDKNKATNEIYGNLIDLDDKGAWKDVGGTRLANQVKAIQKKFGVDSIPAVPGFRNEEVIRIAYEMIDKPKKTATYTPSETKSTTSFNELRKKLNTTNNPDVSKMMIDDGSSTWNSMKLPDNASPMERKIATSSQAARDIIEDNLRKQLASADPKSKQLLEEYLKLFDQYRFK